jgi:hypothetical protein
MRAMGLVVVLMLWSATIAACASSGPVVGAQGRSRDVQVGQEVLIRLPATQTSREWRLTEFDSEKLPVTHRPNLRTNDRGEPEWVARFVARQPGRADVEFMRTAVAPGATGNIGQRMRFGFRVRE